MTSYIGPDDNPTDPDAIAEATWDILTANIANFVPNDNSLSAFLIMGLARMTSIGADVGKQMPLTGFRYFGMSVLGLQPIDDVAATTTITVTAVDDKGYTLPAGTNVGFQVAGDTIIGFQVVDEVIIPPGENVTSTGGVLIQAVVAGNAGNQLGPDGLILIDALAWVESMTAVGATAGGVDAETDEQYISRLIQDQELSSATPVFGSEYGVMARNVVGIFRATGVDNYNPEDDTYDNEKMVGVAGIDENGLSVGADVKTAAAAYLEGLRGLGYVVNMIDATYTTFDVTFTFTPEITADAEAVQQAAVDAITQFLNPATYGVTPGDDTLTSWENQPVVRIGQFYALLLSIDGLRWVNTLTVNGGSGDVTMDGAISLPQPGEIIGSVAT